MLSLRSLPFSFNCRSTTIDANWATLTKDFVNNDILLQSPSRKLQTGTMMEGKTKYDGLVHLIIWIASNFMYDLCNCLTLHLVSSREVETWDYMLNTWILSYLLISTDLLISTALRCRLYSFHFKISWYKDIPEV